MIIKYQKHIDDLAKKLGCRVNQLPQLPGMMYVELGYVEGPIIENQIHYLTLLHELGHFAHGHTQGRPPENNKKFYFENGVLKSEAQAWEWALDHCIDEIQLESRFFIWDTCLGSYYSIGYIHEQGKPARLWNGNRHHIEFIYDDPDEYFNSIVKRIQDNVKDYKIEYKGKQKFENKN